jgi:hypothetical protein
MKKLLRGAALRVSKTAAVGVVVLMGGWIPAAHVAASTLPTLAVSDTKVVESPTGNVKAFFTVTLSSAQATDVLFSYTTRDGTAVASGDYQVTSGTGTVTAGATRLKISVEVKSDIGHDPSPGPNKEQFYLDISNPVGATILRGEGTCTIKELPTVNIGDASVVEPLSSPGTNPDQKVKAFFTVTLTPPQPNNIQVSWVTADGTAKAGEDYRAGAGTLTILAGLSSAKIGVIIKPDNGNDVSGQGNETFYVSLTSLPVGFVSAQPTGLGTIIELDPPGPAALSAGPGTSLGQVALSWTPGSDGGSPITDYTYEVSQDGGATWSLPVDAGLATSATDSTCGVATCSYEVFTTNAAGTGPASNVATASPNTPPGPAALSAGPGINTGQVALSWTPPTPNGGSAITDYTYEVSQDGGATWSSPVDAGLAASATDSTCMVATCSYEVFTTNTAGTGPASNVATASPAP